MSEMKLPFTEKVAKIIVAVVIILLLGGYVLYFSAKGRLHAQGKELEALKTEYATVKQSFSEIKTKYDGMVLDIKQMTDTVQNNMIKYQECQQKLNALEAKYESMKTSPPVQKAPQSAEQSTPSSSAPTAPTTPAEPTAPASPPAQ